MVALMKMSESRLRWRVSIRDCGETFSGLSEYGDDDGECALFENVVSNGESIWRFARGELGRPHGERGVVEDMFFFSVMLTGETFAMTGAGRFDYGRFLFIFVRIRMFDGKFLAGE